jgi:transposase
MDGNIDSGLVSRLGGVETGRRRRWSDSETLRIVAESMAGPRLVSATARRHGISRWQLDT